MQIRNWDRWQSYRKDRGMPPWIKIHRALMRDPNWVGLSDAQRGQLVSIWMLGADRDGIIPDDPAVIRKLCFMDTEPDLNIFKKLGFLEGCQDGVTLASTGCQHDAPEKSRVEKIREEGADAPPLSENKVKKTDAESQKSFRNIFWPRWPHKVGKPVAETAFKKALDRGNSVDTIMTGLDRYVASKPSDRPWLNPSTFLNQDRFLDQPAPLKGSATAGAKWKPFVNGHDVQKLTPEEKAERSARAEAAMRAVRKGSLS